MVQLTFHGGVNEIGGNKILLEDGDTKIFLDFGMSFTKRGLYFEEFVTPRTANGIGDFLAMNLIPDISGVYRTDLLQHQKREAKDPSIAGVLLSHAHADHANYISFLHQNIPIYCGQTCKKILDAVDEQSQRSIESEVINFKERPIYRDNRRKPPIQRTFHTFRTNTKINIDSLEIRPIHVDHSVPGAYGFIIHTSKGAVVYTGDLRMHGLHAEMTKDFITAAEESKPIAMITEGTRIDVKHSNESEQNVFEQSKQHLLHTKHFSIVDFNFKDIDRFTTFYNLAKKLNKKLVISFRHACFLDKYHQDKSLNAPESTDEYIMLLKPKRLTGTYIAEDYVEKYIKKRLNYPNIITAEEIAKNPLKYIIVLNYWYFQTLIDLNPKKGLYIHSLSEPFNEEMEISADRMNHWLNHFNLKFIQAHCSGHIYGGELKKIIQKINPKTLFPIHTEQPELFKKIVDSVQMVKEQKVYKL
ncbi:MAG: MBL fold metallo-hydrolase [Thermoplasmatota archaeon]